MTQEQVNFCILVHDYAQREFGYSFAGLRLNGNDQSWTLRLKALDAPESQVKQFTVFNNQLREAAAKRQLPRGLICSFADEFIEVQV